MHTYVLQVYVLIYILCLKDLLYHSLGQGNIAPTTSTS